MKIFLRAWQTRLPSLLLLIMGTAFMISSAPRSKAMAEEVRVEFAGIELLANLQIAPGKSLRKNGVTLLVHDTFRDYSDSLIAELQQLLSERGINSLAINLSYGLDQRRGPYPCELVHDHRHEDAIEEIKLWRKWLQKAGARRIFLAGHGRGANQVAQVVAQFAETGKKDKSIKGVILIAPLVEQPAPAPPLPGQPPLQNRQPSDAPKLAEANRMIAADEGDLLLEPTAFLSCPKARVTAHSYANYYAPNPKLNTLNLLPSLLLPVLAVTGSQAPDGPAMAELMSTSAQTNKQLTVSIIDGAGADFEGSARQILADIIAQFQAIP